MILFGSEKQLATRRWRAQPARQMPPRWSITINWSECC